MRLWVEYWNFKELKQSKILIKMFFAYRHWFVIVKKQNKCPQYRPAHGKRTEPARQLERKSCQPPHNHQTGAAADNLQKPLAYRAGKSISAYAANAGYGYRSGNAARISAKRYGFADNRFCPPRSCRRSPRPQRFFILPGRF